MKKNDEGLIGSSASVFKTPSEWYEELIVPTAMSGHFTGLRLVMR